MIPARSLIAIALLLAAAAAPAAPAHPRISMQAARARALAVVPHGRVASAELEREHGRLIYSFDIRVAGQPGIEEVQISAIDGGLVSRTHETPAAERREARAEPPGHR
jgi:uncharacterized membrane protein YkoI